MHAIMVRNNNFFQRSRKNLIIRKNNGHRLHNDGCGESYEMINGHKIIRIENLTIKFLIK